MQRKPKQRAITPQPSKTKVGNGSRKQPGQKLNKETFDPKLQEEIERAVEIRDKLVDIMYSEELCKRSREYRVYRKDRMPDKYKEIDARLYENCKYPCKSVTKLRHKLKDTKSVPKTNNTLLNKLL